MPYAMAGRIGTVAARQKPRDHDFTCSREGLCAAEVEAPKHCTLASGQLWELSKPGDSLSNRTPPQE
ncbi:hypothetical protein Y1Q_0014936 [Alligator mississippiensis]|uniref:Uncharacterized protein n=1 Tax=Alligator mississippiensis TaxID=8496 RepID=A0A151N8I8_ALLMI|nr:hypothetical protein Y1Q_0014936 [Alligator mississippiensis]